MVIRDVRYEDERLTEYDLGPRWRVEHIGSNEFSSTRRWYQLEEPIEALDETEWRRRLFQNPIGE